MSWWRCKARICFHIRSHFLTCCSCFILKIKFCVIIIFNILLHMLNWVLCVCVWRPLCVCCLVWCIIPFCCFCDFIISNFPTSKLITCSCWSWKNPNCPIIYNWFCLCVWCPTIAIKTQSVRFCFPLSDCCLVWCIIPNCCVCDFCFTNKPTFKCVAVSWNIWTFSCSCWEFSNCCVVSDRDWVCCSCYISWPCSFVCVKTQCVFICCPLCDGCFVFCVSPIISIFNFCFNWLNCNKPTRKFVAGSWNVWKISNWLSISDAYCLWICSTSIIQIKT